MHPAAFARLATCCSRALKVNADQREAPRALSHRRHLHLLDIFFALNGGVLTAAFGHLGKSLLGRVAADNQIGDAVGVLLVRVICSANSASESDTALLLNDVGGFMRRGVKVGCLAKANSIAESVGARAESIVGRGRGAARLGANRSDVVSTKRGLDL